MSYLHLLTYFIFIVITDFKWCKTYPECCYLLK
uniref:Uncharacterized protein n=1 Tax=Anguilla anguilla TaxID=7936 RepID=A0A0E9XAW6_ANGAN